MRRMPKSKPILVLFTAEMRSALDAYCAEHGVDRSELIRDAVLRKIGRKDLIGTMPGRGQPRKKRV